MTEVASVPDHVIEKRDEYFIYPEDNKLLRDVIREKLNFLGEVFGNEWLDDAEEFWFERTTREETRMYSHKGDLDLNMMRWLPPVMIKAYRKMIDDFRQELKK
jgi:hypothetical protein